MRPGCGKRRIRNTSTVFPPTVGAGKVSSADKPMFRIVHRVQFGYICHMGSGICISQHLAMQNFSPDVHTYYTELGGVNPVKTCKLLLAGPPPPLFFSHERKKHVIAYFSISLETPITKPTALSAKIHQQQICRPNPTPLTALAAARQRRGCRPSASAFWS